MPQEALKDFDFEFSDNDEMEAKSPYLEARYTKNFYNHIQNSFYIADLKKSICL